MSDSNQPRLPVLVNLNTDERHTIAQASMKMGRAPDNAIVLPDDGYASAQHARIFWHENRWWIEDLGSSNGTAINDQKITEPWQLAPGEVIKTGRTLFRIE